MAFIALRQICPQLGKAPVSVYIVRPVAFDLYQGHYFVEQIQMLFNSTLQKPSIRIIASLAHVSHTRAREISV